MFDSFRGDGGVTTEIRRASVTYDDYCNRKYVPAFDALRAISVMLVVTVHVHFGSWVWLGGVDQVAPSLSPKNSP